jgi:multidrug transporter EmrE-like cation transporter
MFHLNFKTNIQTMAAHINMLIIALILGNLLFNIIANASFKVSAESSNLKSFLFWQVVGNLAGLITVITLTGLMRYIPLHIAFPITTGLAVIGVEVIAGLFLFGESISFIQWAGTILVVLGIALLSGR